MTATHPIERNDYLILTKPIERIMASLCDWLRFNFPGAMIYGQRRRGKSRCLAFVKKYLAGALGYPIAVVVFCMRKHDVQHESVFLDDLLDALGVSVGRVTKAKKMEMIRNRLLVLARRCPTRKVVLATDDAQRLETIHYEILMSIFNELYEMYKVNLFVLLVGQPQLKAKKDLFVHTGQMELVARMMPDEVEFTGHRSLEELRFAFNRYDHHCYWPVKSKISFTAHHAPQAFENGWTLESEAQGLWDAYVAEREARNLSPVEEMSMHALTAMAHYILVRYASKPTFTGLKLEDITNVIRAVGFLQIETPRQSNDEEESDDDDE
jgi:hypothetical protein